MTDSGWDIPGVPRDAAAGSAAAAGAAALAGPDGPGTGRPPGRRRAGSRMSRASASVSALAGSSAGAFARSAGGGGLSQPACSSCEGAPSGEDAALTPAAVSPAGSPSAGSRSAGSETAGCGAGPHAAAEALRSLSAVLDFLTQSDPGLWPEGLQADCLRALAVAESRQAAAHAKVLAAFSVPGGGLAGDGHRSARVWLTWQTQATRPAAGAKVGWMRRLQAHPVTAAALAGGVVSLSWAHQVCDWTDRLPSQVRDSADAELLAAASRRARA